MLHCKRPVNEILAVTGWTKYTIYNVGNLETKHVEKRNGGRKMAYGEDTSIPESDINSFSNDLNVTFSFSFHYLTRS